jgi:UPF0755 protein
MAGSKKNGLRGLLYVTVLLIALGLLLVYKVYGPATGDRRGGEYLYVHTGSDYEQLVASLKKGGFIKGTTVFGLLARMAKLPQHVHAGKYRIKPGMSNYEMVRMLRSGRQAPVKLMIGRLRTKEEFINLLSANLEADSLTLRHLLNDPVYVSAFGLDTNTVLCAVIPDTYDFFWNISADKAFRKIEKNYARFWDSTRRQQARDHGLTPIRAVIIASIVDEESNKNEDKPKIASVYINRLNKGMKLQADPTVKYAVGDFTIRRITGAMLQNPSPYNTYLYEGLPPGPICTPSVNSVEAVLQAPKTTYLYFCAKEDFSGYSNFASTYDEQMKNARAYQKALDARGIH